ncbi:hemolysin III family protein [Aquisalimonas lutea]|uniref:PAQR family membrane homeostasis protein TrhA n=1 Tax=Aquisalimonas lutea TaxID=1327750 RepID=UPI0025B60EBE|nr:hemolysin III family protein [Aquisalimonas lutea]MDN3518244.1 hemolysin III family protein [Aquisalimonas lutea]
MSRLVRAYTRAEQWVDRVVHWIGLSGAIVALVALLIVAGYMAEGSPSLWASLLVYGLGLIGMLVCSTLSNHDFAERSRWAGLYQRLDHAGILLMIAATYTPLTLHVVGGTTGWLLCLFIWLVAGTGMALRLFRRRPLQPRSSVALYLLLGWSGVFALKPLISSASLSVLILVLLGGLLYSLGVPFFLWRRLPFHRAIWHAFVLSAAACHYAAVLIGVALAGGATASS